MDRQISNKSKEILSYVARNSLEFFLKNGQRKKFNFGIAEILEHKAVFVTLWEREIGALRGCIGHIEARYPLVNAVSKTVISSALEDPRFEPLTKNELDNINIEISVLSPLKKILPEEIEIGKHGLRLVKGSNSSVFLPEVAVSQGWNKKKLLDELSLKAGMNKECWKDAETKLQCFESESWFEN